MCRDCPTPRSRAKGVVDELIGWVVLPFAILAIVLGMAVLGNVVLV
ncbi:hypothetical protein K8W59_07475 [Nocardioides rotundus]|nr:hypothetical protein [Nocardioides rotundus]UAL31284.1 hypothetical protein K8W59_07475 [Nocardioides rotundus]